jgi:hypothetical protein
VGLGLAPVGRGEPNARERLVELVLYLFEAADRLPVVASDDSAE